MSKEHANEPQIPHPDTIQPQSPPEAPPSPQPNEAPMTEPPEITPEQPDRTEPGETPVETPPPDNLDDAPAGAPHIGDGGVLQSNLDRMNDGSIE